MSDNCGRAVNANLGRRHCPENVRVAARFTTPRENQTSDNHLNRAVYDGAFYDSIGFDRRRNLFGSAMMNLRVRIPFKSHKLEDWEVCELFIKKCLKHRTIENTTRNTSGSSRSHQLILVDMVFCDAKNPAILSNVLFGDLAGNEDKETKRIHRVRETSAINSEVFELTDQLFPYVQRQIQGKRPALKCNLPRIVEKRYH